ncbi:hypothetical protein E9993_22455 [Labilibacter sediminis]|nr:hypothetical protein E9993_22455 [Labilibacter sediminis]
MKGTNKILWLLLLLTIIGCGKDDNPKPDSQNNYKRLISATEVASYSQAQTKILLTLAENQLGEDMLFTNKEIHGFKVFYVEYKSEYINNEDVTLSGLVCTPNNVSKEALIISFQNGTMSLHSSAPSKNLTHPEFLILQSLAGLGFVITIPDYIGFGASEHLQHPYHHKKLFQRSISDLIIAAKDMEESEKYGFSLSGDLFLTGYSLGGWASLLTHYYLEQTPIENINLVGSACGAGAYNLIHMRDYLVEQTDYTQPFYVPNLLLGYQSVGDITEELSTYLNEPYASIVPDLIDGKHSSGEINAQLTKNMQELLTDGFINDFYSSTESQWIHIRNVLTENSQLPWVNENPISLYHGTTDHHVPIVISEKTVDDFRAIGVGENKLTFFTLEGKDHGTGVMSMYLDVIKKLLEN